MLETKDPHRALKSKSIHDRAAGARDLSRTGTPADIPKLVTLARGDKSPAVRLGVAGAGADILSRHRMGRRADQLDDQARSEILQSFASLDPGINPGLFSLLATVGTPEGFRRICAGLRDPRGEVRRGAAIGLLRYCQSGAVNGDEAPEAHVVELLKAQRLKPDALADLARVAAQVGYRTAAPAIAALDLGGAHGQTVADALEIFEKLDSPVAGCWYSDGADLGEVFVDAQLPSSVLFIAEDGQAVQRLAGGWTPFHRFPTEGGRRLWCRRSFEREPGDVLQFGARTWYRRTGAAMLEMLEQVLDLEALRFVPGRAGSAGAALAREVVGAYLDEDAVGDRLRALLALEAGEVDDCVALLEKATGQKKCPPDTWWILGSAQVALGQIDAGKASLALSVKKARRKSDPHVARARAQLIELGD